MPPTPSIDLSTDEIAGIVIGSTAALALFGFLFRLLKRHSLNRRQLDGRVVDAAAYKTKSVDVEAGEEGMQEASTSSPSSGRCEAPDRSAVAELNPYNYRMRPELDTGEQRGSKRSSGILGWSWGRRRSGRGIEEAPPDEKTLEVMEGRNGPHELEARPLSGEVTVVLKETM